MLNTRSEAAIRGQKFFRTVIVPMIEFVCALGTQVCIYLGTTGKAFAFSGALGMGVSPASNLATPTNIAQSLVTSWDKVFIENLKANTPWVRLTSRRQLDENSGNKLQLFMYVNLPTPPLTQAPEGVIGTGLTVQVVSNTSAIGNYADFANISLYALQTAIDPALEALGVQMAYRLAQVIDLLIQKTADDSSVTDAKVIIAKVAGEHLTDTDVTAAAQSLAGINALPLDNGRYGGVIHPFPVGDILSDKTNNSLTDVVKRTAEGTEMLKELPSPDGNRVQVIDWGGVTFYQSTLVHTAGTAPATTFRTYFVGKDGLIGISFGSKENTQIGDGDWRNLNVWVKRISEPSGYDPSKMIGKENCRVN